MAFAVIKRFISFLLMLESTARAAVGGHLIHIFPCQIMFL